MYSVSFKISCKMCTAVVYGVGCHAQLQMGSAVHVVLGWHLRNVRVLLMPGWHFHDCKVCIKVYMKVYIMLGCHLRNVRVGIIHAA